MVTTKTNGETKNLTLNLGIPTKTTVMVRTTITHIANHGVKIDKTKEVALYIWVKEKVGSNKIKEEVLVEEAGKCTQERDKMKMAKLSQITRSCMIK